MNDHAINEAYQVAVSNEVSQLNEGYDLDRWAKTKYIEQEDQRKELKRLINDVQANFDNIIDMVNEVNNILGGLNAPGFTAMFKKMLTEKANRISVPKTKFMK